MSHPCLHFIIIPNVALLVAQTSLIQNDAHFKNDRHVTKKTVWSNLVISEDLVQNVSYSRRCFLIPILPLLLLYTGRLPHLIVLQIL